jgi:aminopeptidase S
MLSTHLMTRTATALLVGGLAAAGSILATVPAAATPAPLAPPGRAAPAAPDVDVAEVKADLDELQRLAEANDGNRATGTSGFQASSDFVTGELESAGFAVTQQPFNTSAGPTWNLITEIPGQDPGKVIMVGAHLDGVQDGPGINDNGSGSSAILATALALKQALPNPAVTIRFAWWSGEELGLLGSEHYVEEASSTELSAIQGYLNLDMIGSSNAGYFVYDDDPTIESRYQAYFRGIGIPTEIETEGDGRSDHAPFKDAGVPVGGLFSGAENVKTAAQARAWGGTAGKAFDSCYHRRCDTVQNVNLTSVDRMTDATASVLYGLASE